MVEMIMLTFKIQMKFTFNFDQKLIENKNKLKLILL